MGQKVLAHLVHTATDELLGLVLDVRHTLPAVVNLRLGPQPVVVGIGVAPDRRPGRRHPAGVEPNQVEPFVHPLRQCLEDAQGGLDTGFAGSTGIYDQRTDLVSRRRKANQRQRRHVTIGAVVVDRYSELAA